MDSMVDRKLYAALPYLVILVLGLAIVMLLKYIIPYRYSLTQEIQFEESAKPPLDNPLMGYAPPAQNVSACQDTNLVYIGLTWAMWEPEEGMYDIEGLEKEFHITQWKAQKKHAVLRFICDLPDDEEHMDLPVWLYEKTGDGARYSNAYGKGYAPDYSNSYLRERHKKAIAALAEYCNRDSFVAYVELGSLGHWGEWHTDRKALIPQMPDAEICRQYVMDYTDHFSNARMLMRRNYAMAVNGGLGIYNDMMGAEEDTEAWLSWMKEGGSYPTQGAPLTFIPVERFWEKGPGGGELTSRYEMEELLGKRLMTTLDTIERSHASFIGPNCPTKELLKSDASNTILESLGYRYYISELRTSYSFREHQLDVSMNWKSVGAAPLYWDWPVTVYLYDRSQNLQYQETLDLNLSELVPGEEKEIHASIPFTETLRRGYQIGIGIASPDGRETIRLAMEAETFADGIQIIYEYKPD